MHFSIQSNQLSTTYNSSHPKKGIALHPSEIQLKEKVKGVSHTVGIILNLLEELKVSESSEHFFFIPDHTFSLTESETGQLLKELARGIYIYDTIPFFSLHFNSRMEMYPVVHPVYQNTFIGYTISMLDYYMKGFCNGSFFEEAFIEEWNKNPTVDEKILKEKSIDFREYCKKHLGEAALTFNELFLEIEKQSGTSSQGLIFAKNFDISYRIIGKQNSIKKAESLFTLDSDFDVVYTIKNQPSNKDQEVHFQNLEKACQLMCKQIKEKMPRLPGMKKLFDAMNLMNFYVYYFNTLKAAEKIPTLNHISLPTESKVCYSLFPPLPESEAAKMSFKPASLFKRLSEEQITAFINYLKQPNAKDLEESALDILTLAIKNYVLQKGVNKDFTDYKVLALTLMPACKGRYQATHRNAEATLVGMEIKANPSENLSVEEIFSRMNKFVQRIEKDIEDTKKRIENKKTNRLSHAEESQWLLEFQQNKKEAIKYKALLEKWFKDPLGTIFAEAVISLNLITKSLTLTKETSSGKIHVAGGCGIHVKDMMAQVDLSSDFLFKKYDSILSSTPSHKTIKVEAGEQGAPGILFKLAFENFHIIEEDPAQSAIGYLYPSSSKYPMTDATVRAFHSIHTQDKKLFAEIADQIQEWNFQDALGVSFIHYAASIPDTFFLHELINKVDLTTRDSQGLTALHYAAKEGSLACLKILMTAAPTMLDVQANDGETPLYVAAQNNQLAIVQLLLKEKANLNLVTKHGMNILMCALHHKHEQIALELLKNQSVDLEHRHFNGRTALHFAIETKMEKVLKELINKGMDVNRILRNGYRPIHLAVAHNWLSGVKILAASPNINLKALSFGKTAMDLAVENNKKEIMEFFQPSGACVIS